MTIPLNPKQMVSFEELLMSQVVQQEALTRLLVEKRIFTKEEFLERVRGEGSRNKKEKKPIRRRGNNLNIDKNATFGIVNSTILINLSLSKGGGGWRKTFKNIRTRRRQTKILGNNTGTDTLRE